MAKSHKVELTPEFEIFRQDMVNIELTAVTIPFKKIQPEVLTKIESTLKDKFPVIKFIKAKPASKHKVSVEMMLEKLDEQGEKKGIHIKYALANRPARVRA